MIVDVRLIARAVCTEYILLAEDLYIMMVMATKRSVQSSYMKSRQWIPDGIGPTFALVGLLLTVHQKVSLPEIILMISSLP